MSHATRLDKASSYFFLLGFFLSKIQYIPLTIISSTLKFSSLIMYFLGYLLWIIGSHIYPDHNRLKNQWYGFAQFKEQYQCAAIIGLIATVLSIIAIFVPILILPAAWLFLSSNVIWTIGEYHKLNNPPEYELNYSHGHQSVYLSYAMTMSTITLLTAVTTTLMIIFPLIALPVFMGGALLGIGLGALGLEYWLEFSFGNHPLTPIKESYRHMNYSLGPSGTKVTSFSESYHNHTVFMEEELKPKKLIPYSNDLTCKSSS